MSQKTNSMIKLALVFFICLLSFSIGTYVGKKYSDNQHKLAQLEPNKKAAGHGGEEFAANEGEGHGEQAGGEQGEKHESGETTQKLTDSEVAKIAEEFASDSSSDNAHDEKAIQTIEADEKPIKSAATEKANTHVTPASHGATTAVMTNTIATKALPTKTSSTVVAKPMNHDREPSSLPQPKEGASVGSHFTVQIGSFPNEADAQKMTKEMLAKGIKTSYVSAQVKGQVYYRVNVGLFGTSKEADEYKKDFLEKTKLTSAFVQKVQ